jgi:hypothetical protein
MTHVNMKPLEGLRSITKKPAGKKQLRILLFYYVIFFMQIKVLMKIKMGCKPTKT